MERPSEPWCLLVKSRWGDPIIIRAPESRAPWFLTQGWRVLVAESEFPPLPPLAPVMDLRRWQSNPIRRADSENAARELDDDDRYPE